MPFSAGGNHEEFPDSEWGKSFQHVREWEKVNAPAEEPVEEPESDPEPAPKKKTKKP